MEAVGTYGLFTRLAGIPTYAPCALPEDPDDVRAHGRDERLGVEAFHQATEFWYRMMKTWGGMTRSCASAVSVTLSKCLQLKN
jgi:acetylornithine deacetylase/succinyl-diaminopimelate desuccinylase-like protein